MPHDLNKLTAGELGKLFPIIIVDYNPEWERLYLDERKNIQDAIGIYNILRIEHIGSTAVPGLCAKPTIDILLEIADDWDEIVFREYLIRNPGTARQYGDLKRQLSIKYRNDREMYTDHKGDFIKRITRIARSQKQ
jgi:GrpB-like predicted nucleotidyltransferase (UPF0157 family)